VCRHLAYLGPEVSLGSLLVQPPSSLWRQAWAPRRQTHGVVNADGFGVGWYVEGDPVPARYRRSGPIWADETFTHLARVVRSHAVLAAVRSASPGMGGGETAAAPFAAGPWLFSHNGIVHDWPASAEALGAGLTRQRLAALDAPIDSALVWALVLERLEHGAAPADALAEVVAAAEAGPGGRYNLLLTDGEQIAATALGNSLAVREGDGWVVVASEAHDDDPSWVDVQDRSVVLATRDGAKVVPL
jgi:gamma-glutamyl hercynylcysteine S-oxide hydrolase